MTSKNVIAIICDCDRTLCPDTTESLIRTLGYNEREFWKEVDVLVNDGWDPPIAYLTQLLKGNYSDPPRRITRKLLDEVGRKTEFYPGVLDFVERLQGKINSNREFKDARITLELFIITGGIEEILVSSKIRKIAKEIFGCLLNFPEDGTSDAIKRVVSFTEKTKFVFAINKGISANELQRKPYKVNDFIKQEERRIPIRHMIYIGDGPSDIPCFSMIKDYGGNIIGVMPPEDKDLKKPYELSQGARLTVGPYTADYRDGTDLYKMLSRIVDGISDKILIKRAESTTPAPTH